MGGREKSKREIENFLILEILLLRRETVCLLESWEVFKQRLNNLWAGAWTKRLSTLLLMIGFYEIKSLCIQRSHVMLL